MTEQQAPPCEHACCVIPNDTTHMHLFAPSICPGCQLIATGRATRTRKEHR